MGTDHIIVIYEDEFSLNLIKRKLDLMALNFTPIKMANSTKGYNFFQMKNSERKRSVTHFLIWRYMVEKRLENVMILETNVSLRFDIRFVLMNFNLKYDAILLDGSSEPGPLEEWVQTDPTKHLSSGYILSLKAAIYLNEIFTPLIYSLEIMIGKLKECYTYFPWLVIQPGTDLQEIKKVNYLSSNYV